MMGTPLYMSPEQMRSSRDVGAQTDIWALGAILFELMAGRAAFLAESLTELAISVNNEPPPSVRTFRPDVPAGLEAIIFKCLEKDPRQRYGNVAELALALLPFAPKRAKGSVERISGIIQSAGLSTSALAVPASPPIDATQASAGTLPPVGRTTVGGNAGKKSVVGVSLAGALVLAALVGAVMLRQGSGHRDDPSAAAGGPSATPTVSTAAPQPPPPSDSPNQKADVLPSAAPSSKPVPAGSAAVPAVTTKRKQPTPGPAPTPPPAPAGAAITPPSPVPAPPAAGKCDPPYYFDANGTRLFKKECL